MEAVLPADIAETSLSGNVLKLQKFLLRQVGRAIADFGMIEEGDRVMVCCSGGKDSYTLLTLLSILRQRAPIDFSIVAMNLDQKQPGFPDEVLPRYFESIGVEYRIVTEDTYSIVKGKVPEGKTTCALCSRLRRGIIYRTAREIGATKIALGHHREDIIETLFLNMFFGGKLKAMPPKLVSDDGQHVVIRPLAYCNERDVAKFARAMAYPIIPCNLCGTQENAQRKQIKAMLADWETRFPGRVESITTALQNVVPSHLADGNLYNFKSLSPLADSAGGDLVFDPPELDTGNTEPVVAPIVWNTRADPWTKLESPEQ
ncbi:tRNA 2-thiocytidine(32) synthetase TtcA [Uliginosibacterium sp. H1]|uniref:tRNA 2-thiocytidine(32) synthetase TtcA n=1 Tax=Uliginosibacterium sp. H1 TaxID=3114757 RepID=UPI002E1995D6|nr:tRNA 2-thiocytidine(32) synthetase TtcA [Uliginosibacterium sp. H1]